MWRVYRRTRKDADYTNHVQALNATTNEIRQSNLLKIHNNIVEDMDNSKVTSLALLDISAAFDAIDHLIIFTPL